MNTNQMLQGAHASRVEYLSGSGLAVSHLNELRALFQPFYPHDLWPAFQKICVNSCPFVVSRFFRMRADFLDTGKPTGRMERLGKAKWNTRVWGIARVDGNAARRSCE
jgi:hypothetical protein